MKKSHLKNIIRESIKQLMVERDSPSWTNQPIEGCMDPNALNGPGSVNYPNGECCDDPSGRIYRFNILHPHNCVPTIPNNECCKYCTDPDWVNLPPEPKQGYCDNRGGVTHNFQGADCITANGSFVVTINNPTWGQSTGQWYSSWFYGGANYCPCCIDERGRSEDKGCEDPKALNNGECCNGDPNCTVIGSNPECCRYEEDPEPCKKCCCEKSHTPGEVSPKEGPDPMGGCKLNTQTQLSPTTNPCECPQGTIETPCKPKPIPTNDFPIGLDESIVRMQKLANINKK
jgi:hypothetical protein